MVSEPSASVPSLAVAFHDNETSVSKIVISLKKEGDAGRKEISQNN